MALAAELTTKLRQIQFNTNANRGVRLQNVVAGLTSVVAGLKSVVAGLTTEPQPAHRHRPSACASSCHQIMPLSRSRTVDMIGVSISAGSHAVWDGPRQRSPRFSIESVWSQPVRHAVSGRVHPFVQDGLQLGELRCASGIVGQVLELIGIRLKVVQLDFRPRAQEYVGLCCGQLPFARILSSC